MSCTTAPSLPCVNASGWRGQFANPRGIFGRIAGYVMAMKNRAMNDFVISQVLFPAGSTVLEIGPGSGATLVEILVRQPTARVIGIDRSQTMVNQSRARIARRGLLERADLQCAISAKLPVPDATVDIIIAVNVVQFIGDLNHAFDEMRRVLRPGGIIAIGLRRDTPKRWYDPQPGFSAEQVEMVAHALSAAEPQRLLRRNARIGRDVTCLIWSKPDRKLL